MSLNTWMLVMRLCTWMFTAPHGQKHTVFFDDQQLSPVLREKYNLVILWLGSNDVKQNSIVREIVLDIKRIVVALEANCEAEVRICLLEPRRPSLRGMFNVDDKTYVKISKSVNRSLYRTVMKGKSCIGFCAKPYWEGLTWNGIHFNKKAREHIHAQLASCINEAYFYHMLREFNEGTTRNVNSGKEKTVTNYLATGH